MTRPRLLDLFCGAGGAAKGYHDAGFDVVGVDLVDQPRYPYDFILGDALVVLDEWINAQWIMPAWGDEFDAIHASPPCQDYSRAMRHLAGDYPRLIDPTRDLFEATGLPWIIENVPGAPLPTAATLDDRYGVELCGSMFGLRVRRHRLFETNFDIVAPRGCDHRLPALNAQNQAGRDRIYAEYGRQDPDPIWNEAMGVGWMGRYEGREAIPPAYTQYIGTQLLEHLRLAATLGG